MIRIIAKRQRTPAPGTTRFSSQVCKLKKHSRAGGCKPTCHQCPKEKYLILFSPATARAFVSFYFLNGTVQFRLFFFKFYPRPIKNNLQQENS